MSCAVQHDVRCNMKQVVRCTMSCAVQQAVRCNMSRAVQQAVRCNMKQAPAHTMLQRYCLQRFHSVCVLSATVFAGCVIQHVVG